MTSARHDDGVKAQNAILLLAALIVSCESSPTAATPPITSTPTPTGSAAESPSAAARTFSLDYVKATPLGPLTGDNAVIVRHGIEGANAVRELVVLDLAGGPARVALHYRRKTPELVDAQSGPVSLARQLSPDGKRVVLDDAYLPTQPSATKTNDPGQPLLIADLETGKLTFLSIPGVATDSVDPAWSPGGEIIAFARRLLGAPRFGDDGVWIVGTDGAGLRRLTDGESSGYSYVFGWTGDGAGVAFGVGGIGLDHLDYRVVDVRTRTVKKLEGYIEWIDAGVWRRGTPAFAGVFTDDPQGVAPGGETRVVVADETGANVRTVLTQPVNQYGGPRLMNVRWHPFADKLLVEVRDPGQNSVRIIDLASGAVTSTGRARAFRIEWTPSGTELVCLVSSPPTAPISVTTGPLDKACQRELLPATSDWIVLDLVTKRYH